MDGLIQSSELKAEVMGNNFCSWFVLATCRLKATKPQEETLAPLTLA